MASKKKAVVVNRKFLMDLADSIYNTKSRRFIRLCAGTLQNGPDPTNAKRPMHCGLGELYFAMTGHQPEDDGVSEDDVVDYAVEHGPLANLADERREQVREAVAVAEKAVAALKLPSVVKDAVEVSDNASDYDEDLVPEVDEFRDALNDVPSENDGCDSGGSSKKYIDKDGDEVNYCSWEQYRTRAARVASQLRKAAKVLPA